MNKNIYTNQNVDFLVCSFEDANSNIKIMI